MTVNWKLKFFLIVLAAVPAFTGYPLNRLDTVIIPGITWGWICYFLSVHIIVRLVIGSGMYANVISAAALITLPVVFGGGTISYLLHLGGIEWVRGLEASGIHYVSLCVTMLTVIPLAIGGVVMIPVHTIEKNILRDRSGVTRKKRYLLMFLRVFSHILFFVIPNILEVVREERPFSSFPEGLHPSNDQVKYRSAAHVCKHKLAVFLEIMTFLSVEAICSAVQYIPFWAVEIAQLPEKERSIQRSLE